MNEYFLKKNEYFLMKNTYFSKSEICSFQEIPAKKQQGEKTGELKRRIDAMVYVLYGLTEAERLRWWRAGSEIV
ncbi:MAG TPA: hypothetical protein VEC36_08820 [Patescibacteria group bacterium]|nr:hypothetical protein [Patescibacteria group bacterium]